MENGYHILINIGEIINDKEVRQLSSFNIKYDTLKEHSNDNIITSKIQKLIEMIEGRDTEMLDIITNKKQLDIYDKINDTRNKLYDLEKVDENYRTENHLLDYICLKRKYNELCGILLSEVIVIKEN